MGPLSRPNHRQLSYHLARRFSGRRVDPVSQTSYPRLANAPRNPVIAPITVLLGHANDQLLDFSLDPRPARASTDLRAIEFAGDQLAWNTKTGRMLSDSVAPLRVVLSARFCRTCSCITRSISG